MDNLIKSTEMIKLWIKLVNEASKYIRNFKLKNQSDLDISYKGINDPLTKADLTSQFIIENGLKWYFKDLNIVGEEDQNVNQINLNKEELYNKINNLNIVNFEEVEKHLTEQLYNKNESILFIDPIDGTREYISENFNNVTTLIGLSEYNSSSLGLISKPFGKFFDKSNKDIDSIKPLVYFTFKEQNKIFKFELNNIEENKIILENIEIIKSKEHSEINIMKSATKKLEDDKKLIEHLKPNKISQLNGTGVKFLDLIENNSNILVYHGTKTCKWDICAGDALINQIDGHLFDKYFNNYSYKREENYYNNKGLFVGMSTNLKENLIEKMGKLNN